MASETERLARHIVQSLYDATDGRPQQWRGLAGFSDTRETSDAVSLAVERGWLLLEGGHSVCLTDAGRELAKP